MKALALSALAALASSGCGRGATDPTPLLASSVVRAPGATGEGLGDPRNATNGVRGAGELAGSVDVYSLDYGERSELVLGWDGHRVHDGPGADFVVFENAFTALDGSSFMDPIVVSVSRDGETFVELPHAYLAADPTVYSTDPADWSGFAGVTPVLLHAEANPVDPFDREAAGGDAFDLASLPDDAESEAIRREGFRYLRLVPAAIAIDPRTGANHPRDRISNGPDVDGVYARWVD